MLSTYVADNFNWAHKILYAESEEIILVKIVIGFQALSISVCFTEATGISYLYIANKNLPLQTIERNEKINFLMTKFRSVIYQLTSAILGA